MDPFEGKIAADWPLSDWRDLTVLVGVSGGADSVALLRALDRLRGDQSKGTGVVDEPPVGRLVVAHLNHRLRGEEGDADEQFVGILSRKLAIESFAERIELNETSQPDGTEAAARAARYEFFTRVAHQIGARYVAVAHTRDDQAETILHRIIRGTGIAGLAGIPRTRRLSDSTTLIRPMLNVSRAEIQAYLAHLEQPWRKDASNLDLRFTRNRLRHELLPLLAEKFNPRADEAIIRLGRLASESQGVLDDKIAKLLEEAVEITTSDDVLLGLQPLQAERRFVVRELLVQIWRQQSWPRQAMSFSHWDDLANMALGCGDSRQRIFPGEIEVRAEDDQLAMHRRPVIENLP